MKNALNNQVGMLGDMFLWLVANLKQGVIYFIKQALPPIKSAGSVTSYFMFLRRVGKMVVVIMRYGCSFGVPTNTSVNSLKQINLAEFSCESANKKTTI